MWVIAAEDRGGAWNATRLADRVYLEQRDWLDEESLADLRRWQGCAASDSYLDIHRIGREARQSFGRGIARIHGHFNDEPGEQDAKMIRQIIETIRLRQPDASLVIIARDSDGKDRRTGFEQAVAHCRPPFPVLYAGMHPESEAWRIAGFQPATPDEQQRLSAIAQQIGFSPERDPGRLSARNPTDKRDCKRILDFLTDGSEERSRLCLEIPLSALSTDHTCGLSRYLLELSAFFRSR